MSYGCSVTNRKGCNYCLKGKELLQCTSAHLYINDDDCKGNAYLSLEATLEEYYYDTNIEINYCSICGKKLK